MQFLIWIEGTPLALWVQESIWGYPIILTAHAIGMALVVGFVLLLSIRALGYPMQLRLSAFQRLIPLAWSGFTINFVSGVLLFIAKASEFIVKPMFLLKLGLIFLGGITLWFLAEAVFPKEHGQGEALVTAKAKFIAAFSISLWLGAIAAGRLIAYT